MHPTEEKDDLLHARSPGQVMAIGMGAVALSFVFAGIWIALDENAPALGVSLVANVLGMIAIPVAYMTWQGLAIAPSLRLAPLPVSQALWVVGTMIATVPAVLALGSWNQGLVPPPPEYLTAVEGMVPTSPGGWVLTLVSVVVVTPIAEEIVFRGMVQQAARRALGPVTAVVFTAIVFTIWHGQLWNVASLALVGLFLGLVFEATGSLVASIVAHASYNLLVLLIYTYGREVPDFGELAAASESVVETIALSFAPLIALAVAWAAYGRLRNVVPWPEIDRGDDDVREA